MEKKLKKVLEDFFDLYQIEFKKNAAKVPSYLFISYDYYMEYDDEGEYDKVHIIDDISFLDKEKKAYYCNFVTERDKFPETIKQALIDELLYEMPLEEIAYDFSGDMFCVKTGKKVDL